MPFFDFGVGDERESFFWEGSREGGIRERVDDWEEADGVLDEGDVFFWSE